MTYSPYSDVIIKMQKELDAKDREIDYLKSVISGDEPNTFKSREKVIEKLERQLELKDAALREAKRQAGGNRSIIDEKDRTIRKLQEDNLDLRDALAELRRTLEKKQRHWDEEKHKAKDNGRRKHKSLFEKEFETVRPHILERDNYRCAECGSDKNLHVHHKVHRKHGGTNDPDNLITLCKWCHAERHKDEPIYKLMTRGAG